MVGKGENAGYQNFLLFPQCFQKAIFTGSLEVWIVWVKGLKLFKPSLVAEKPSLYQFTKYWTGPNLFATVEEKWLETCEKGDSDNSVHCRLRSACAVCAG